MAAPAEEERAEPVIGKFGEYELLSVAGRGGMGVVYRARHVRLGREVALKMVVSPVLAGESAARRFRFAMSGNGDWLAMYDQQNRLRLHLGKDGSQEMLLRGARSPLRSMTWSPDSATLATGEAIAAGGGDGIIRLYHNGTLQPAGTFSGHTGRVHSLHVSADGRRLVSASADSRIRLWDMTTLQPLGRLPAVDLGLRALGGFSDGGRGIAALSWRNMLVVWRAQQGAEAAHR